MRFVKRRETLYIGMECRAAYCKNLGNSNKNGPPIAKSVRHRVLALAAKGEKICQLYCPISSRCAVDDAAAKLAGQNLTAIPIGSLIVNDQFERRFEPAPPRARIELFQIPICGWRA